MREHAQHIHVERAPGTALITIPAGQLTVGTRIVIGGTTFSPPINTEPKQRR